MIDLDPSDVRYKLYLDTANRLRVARIVSSCRTCDIESVLIQVATRTSKPINRRLQLTPFSFPLGPFFKSFVSFAVLLAMGVPISDRPNNADFLRFFDGRAKLARQALTITCGWGKVSYLLG